MIEYHYVKKWMKRFLCRKKYVNKVKKEHRKISEHIEMQLKFIDHDQGFITLNNQ